MTLDSLIDRVWGEYPPIRAAHTLYADLSKLRRVVTPVPGLHLARHTGGYRIDVDPATIDLHYFRDLVTRAHRSDNDEGTVALLEQALALWRDEPFADLDNPWLGTVRMSLDLEKLAAIVDRNDAFLRLGRHTHLLTDLATTAAAYPLDERLAAQYLLALYRCGHPADALTHYQHVRGHLVEELGVEPGPQLQELHEQILRNDPDLRTTTPAPAPASIPQQLPARGPHFVGRAAELRQLTALLDTTLDAGVGLGGTVVISAIGGAGGIGKTWLALHWAHQHVDWFPDGQLFVDLRGFTPAGQPVTPQAAVRGFLGGLGVEPDRIPVDLDAQTGLYRSLVAGKRMLIVLDNAADTTQITPLLPGSPTCTVLVTTRRYLPSLVTAYHATHIPLDVLTDTEARHLLQVRLGADRVDADPAAVDTLVACCGGFPLAVGIVIGRALTHPDFPLSVLAAELRDTATTLGAFDEGEAAASLPAVLSWSVRALTAGQAQVFALLGIAPGPDTSLPATVALTALPIQQARAVLRELEHTSLIQQHMPGRYRMHDLIRRYATDTARRDLAQNVREAALRRVLDFYTHTAYTADRLLYPHRPPIHLDPPGPGVRSLPLDDDMAALTWLDTEHPALLAAQHTAASHDWYTLVWQMAWALDSFHGRRGHRHDRLDVWRAALDAAGHLSDHTPHVHAHRALGWAYADLGSPVEGIRHLRQALALAEQHHDTDQEARAHMRLTSAWERLGDDRQALEHATRARDLFRGLDQAVLEADALNAMGWYAARLGEFDTARTHCQTALTQLRNHHDPECEGSTLDSLGYIAYHTGHHQEAIGYYQQALTLFDAIGNTYQAATTLDNLGHPHATLGQRDQAHAVWQKALELYQDQGRDADADRARQQLDALDQTSG